MKKLLIDSIPFSLSPQQINQSMRQNDGKLIVYGPIQKYGQENQNGRIYPEDILVRQVDRYIKEKVNENMATGELDHSDKSSVELKNVSHKIIQLD